MDEPVAEDRGRSAAVIGPAFLHAGRQEFFQPGFAGDRRSDDPLLVILHMGKGIHDFESLEVPGHDRLVGLVLIQMGFVGFVGTMEIGAVLKFFLLQESRQFGQEGIEEIHICLRTGLDIPAEDPFLFAVDFGNDLRGAGGAPLGEEMGDLEISDSGFFRQFDPAVELAEIEGIFAFGAGDSDQLNGRAFAADPGVERRGEDRGQDHIDPVVRRTLHEIADDFPVFFTENRNVVIRRQTVAVEPVGVFELLFRDDRIEHFQFEGLDAAVGKYRSRLDPAALQAHFDLIDAGFEILRHIDRKPQ